MCKRRTVQKLLETRDGAQGSIRRNKKCLECGNNFTTYERTGERREPNIGEAKELLREAWAKLQRGIALIP